MESSHAIYNKKEGCYSVCIVRLSSAFCPYHVSVNMRGGGYGNLSLLAETGGVTVRNRRQGGERVVLRLNKSLLRRSCSSGREDDTSPSTLEDFCPSLSCPPSLSFYSLTKAA